MNSLCRSGRHKWIVFCTKRRYSDKDNCFVFDIYSGCARCGEVKIKTKGGNDEE